MTIKNIEYDYVVIGSGAGGGIVFDELKKKIKMFYLSKKGPHIKSENLKKILLFFKKCLEISGYQYAQGNISLPYCKVFRWWFNNYKWINNARL